MFSSCKQRLAVPLAQALDVVLKRPGDDRRSQANQRPRDRNNSLSENRSVKGDSPILLGRTRKIGRGG